MKNLKNYVPCQISVHFFVPWYQSRIKIAYKIQCCSKTIRVHRKIEQTLQSYVVYHLLYLVSFIITRAFSTLSRSLILREKRLYFFQPLEETIIKLHLMQNVFTGSSIINLDLHKNEIKVVNRMKILWRSHNTRRFIF